MRRLGILLLVAACATGCRFHTTVYAPGATGRVLDAATYQPVIGARITRPAIKGSNYSLSGTHRPPEGLPSRMVRSNKRGDFDLPPADKTQFGLMFSPNPYNLAGSFYVSAEGYATNELSGIGSARISWRAELGTILLQRPSIEYEYGRPPKLSVIERSTFDRIVEEYVTRQKKWSVGDYSSALIDAQAGILVFQVTHKDDITSSATPGGGKSMQLHISTATKKVVRELGYQ